MKLIDALITGKVILIGTLPFADKPDLCRVDFVGVDDQEITQVRRRIVEALDAKGIDFDVSSIEISGDRNLRTIVRNPDIIAPLDFDRKTMSALSDTLISIKGVKEFSSSVVKLNSAKEVTDVAAFAEIESNNYISSGSVVTLSFEPVGTGDVGSFKFASRTLERVGTFELAGAERPSYGEVQLNATAEYYVKKGNTVASATPASLGVPDTAGKTRTQPTRMAARANQVRNDASQTTKSFVGSSVNKPVLAGAGLLGLVALGNLANSYSSKKKEEADSSFVSMTRKSKDSKVEVDGVELSRNEAIELYKAL